MTTFRFPDESDEYRKARDELLDAEVELRAHGEAVAAQRRKLSRGGKLKEDYRFERPSSDGGVETVAFENLFAGHDSLLLYTMMFGPACHDRWTTVTRGTWTASGRCGTCST